MHSVRIYHSALTEYDIKQLGGLVVFPPSVSPRCRCPPSHPRLNSNTLTCSDITNSDSLARINVNSHPAFYITDTSTTTWWQSENSVVPVMVEIPLGALREVLLTEVKFTSEYPKAMRLDKSLDGTEWVTLQYFASDCQAVFGLPAHGILTNSTDVNCVSTYSIAEKNGDAQFKFLDKLRPGVSNYLTDSTMQDFVQARYVRVQLLQSFGSIPKRTQFAIKHISISGRACVCNGHSDMCMNGKCVCRHNTDGNNCERCLPLYNKQPWKAGTIKSASECLQCQCYGHSTSCVYDEKSSDGRCVNCSHNTAGLECEQCSVFYYRQPGTSLYSVNVCSNCNCHLAGVTNSGDCQRGDLTNGDSGQCNCKLLTAGRTCDHCIDGFYNLSASNPDGCDQCGCDATGTVGGSVSCDSITGQCRCKPHVVGLQCDECERGYHNLSNPNGCELCHVQCSSLGCSGPGPDDCNVRYTFSCSLDAYCIVTIFTCL